MAMEEIDQEVEAMEAVYASDCTVYQRFPPHLSIFMTPRTADDASVQFVEAVLVIKAGEQYPDVAPDLAFKDVKGLGDSREAKLLGDLQGQAAELSGGPMLVAICEAATDLLTNMNSPEGDCCFCMDPLDDGAKPFMKLMTCFHCFHSDCFGDWWRWIQQQQSSRSPLYPARLQDDDGEGRRLQRVGRCPCPCLRTNEEEGKPADYFTYTLAVPSSEDRNTTTPEELQMQCPVCRKVILAEDVAHVRDYLTKEKDTKPFFLQYDEDTKVPTDILTDAELVRRAQFTAQYEAQLERGGIIELKKLEVIQPGMVIPPRTPPIQETLPEEEQVESEGPTDISRKGATTSEMPSNESNTQGRGRQDTQQRRSHLHHHGGRDGFRGGRSNRGYTGGRSYRGRQGEGIRGNRDHRGRSGTWREAGITETSRMQSQDSRQSDRGAVEINRMQSQASGQLERGAVENFRMQAQDSRQQESDSVVPQTRQPELVARDS